VGAVVIASQLGSEGNAYLRERLPGHTVVDVEHRSLASIPEQASVFIALPINVRGVSVAQAPAGWPWSLEWVQLTSSGIDFYPEWLFGVPLVTSGKGANANQVAEYALAAIFAAAKHLPELWVKDDSWSFSALSPIQGATLGILGLGSIGQALAGKALALGMRVLALGRPGQRITGIAGVEAAGDIHELFSQADHLVIAAPLTPQTRHLVGREVLASARPGLHLVNIARGGLLDQEALLEALDGRIGLATLDVTEPEPLPAGHPLYRHPRVRISPHTSALSTEGMAPFAEKFLDNFARYQRREPLHNRVDIRRGY
jgi:phosphoglycerate dehydrogenase-like enzyme